MAPLKHLAFTGTWRRYQLQALDAFDADRARRERKTHIVAPPGSGKTLLGMELARRVGGPALVLCPNSAIQAQWVRTARRFGAGNDDISEAPGAPLCVLTYQSLCQLRDPDDLLVGAAEHQWLVERATATGATIDDVRRQTVAYGGAAAERRDKEIATITSALKRAVARGEHLDIHLESLLSAPARARVNELARQGVRVLVLDECHHLASLWGYVVRALADELPDAHMIGLTATSPDELDGPSAALYHELLGDIDFTIPTPAVVRDGYLAPYQELVQLTEPLPSELDWLHEHDTRFAELITALHEDATSELSFPRHVIERLGVRSRDDEEAATVRWSDFQRASPNLARAGVRFLHSAGLPLPHGAPRGEAYREPPDLDDWIVLLQDYALRRLAGSTDAAAAQRYEDVARALTDLGFQLSRRGIRRATDDAALVLAGSQAKVGGVTTILRIEQNARGEDLRALILCESEMPATRSALSDAPLAPRATAARFVLAQLADEADTAILSPLLVTGRGVRCIRGDASRFAELLSTSPGPGNAELTIRVVQEDSGLALLTSDDPRWSAREWTPRATALFTAGHSRLLIGTRALLGEGWDCPAVNCLIDLASVAADISVRQMRGRSLRLDPEHPNKLASNWDVVCVAPDSARGASDYQRFIRRHQHLHAPCEDGSIEVGPSHVHAALSPFSMPSREQMRDVNDACLSRAHDPERARSLWGIGQPYRGIETGVVTIRTPRVPARMHRQRPPDYDVAHTGALRATAGGLAAVIGATVLTATAPLAGAAALASLPAWWVYRQMRTGRELFGPTAPLDLVARALTETYTELGELPPEVADSLVIEPRAGGFLRVRLHDANEEQSRRFATALDMLLTPAAAPRYLLSRPVAYVDDQPLAMLARGLRGRLPYRTWDFWHPVPDDLGTHKTRAEALARQWRRWVAPTAHLVFTQRSEQGRRALTEAQAQDSEFHSQLRTVWD